MISIRETLGKHNIRVKGLLHKIAIVLVVFAILGITYMRIYLGASIPLLLQADAKYDDYLLVHYADSIYNNNWLGDYSHTTYLKVASSSVLMVIGRVLGLDYGLGLALLYVVSVAILVLSLNKLIDNKIWTVCTYVFLLFSPIMFHAENVQKIYRGGYIVSLSLLVIAGTVGIFASSKESLSNLIKWTILESICLPIFWFLKEDSMWLLLFVCVGMLISIVSIVINKANKSLVRILLCIIPLFVLMCSRFAYSEKNYTEYALRAETDRSGTAFADVISDLLHIKDASEDTSWVTRDALHKACSASATLGTIEDTLMEVYDARSEQNGNVDGDFVIMAIREAASEEGIYNTNAAGTEQFYRNIDNELKQAFAEGFLEREDNRIYISHVSRGYTVDEIKTYYKDRFVDNMLMLISYDHNETDVKQSTGSDDNMALMREYAGDKYITETTDTQTMKLYNNTVGLISRITDMYRMSAKTICKVAMVGFLLSIVVGIMTFIYHKTTQGESFEISADLWLLVISLGLFLTCILMVIAVIWFCNFLTDWKVYDYCSAIIPIIELLESIGIYLFIKNMYLIGRRVYGHIH